MIKLKPLEAKLKSHLEFTGMGMDDPFKFTTDNLMTNVLGFRITRNLYFYKAIRDTLQRLFEAGFLNY